MSFEPAGYRLKLSSDYGVTHPAGVVSNWLSTDGYGNLTTQITPANRPTFSSAGMSGLDAITFNATSTLLTLATNTLTDNLFAGGGTIFVVLQANSAGASSAGRIIEKVSGSGAAAWNLITSAAGGGFYQILFNQVTSGTIGSFHTNSVVALSTPQMFAMTYDSLHPEIPPVFRVIGVAVATVTSSAPTGTSVSDSGGAYSIGNRAAADRGLDGSLGSIYMWNRVLTDYELTNLELFLANKWDITLFNDWSNPYPRGLSLTYGARDFIVTVPPSGSRPMILALHGGGGDAITFIIQLQLGPLLGNEAVLVFPTATYNNATDSGRTWNSGGVQTYNQAPDSTYLSNLVDFVTAQVAAVGVDITDVYIVGHSNGGMMGYRLVIDHPTKFAGVFAISADVMVTNPNVFSGKINHYHGQDDMNVPLAGGVGLGGVYFTPVLPTVQNFTHVNSGTGVILNTDFFILPSPAAHIMSSLATALALPPYSTTFAQLIYDFVIP